MSSIDGIDLRAATGADIDALMACERLPGYEDTVGRWSRDEHSAGVADESHRYVVALDREGEIVGFVMLQEIGSTSGAVLVRRIAVARQGRGIGRILLERAFAVIFDELHAEKAWLRVWPHNTRGMALYSAAGMREDGRSETLRNGAPASMTIMSIDAERYRARQPRS